MIPSFVAMNSGFFKVLRFRGPFFCWVKMLPKSFNGIAVTRNIVYFALHQVLHVSHKYWIKNVISHSCIPFFLFNFAWRSCFAVAGDVGWTWSSAECEDSKPLASWMCSARTTVSFCTSSSEKIQSPENSREATRWRGRALQPYYRVDRLDDWTIELINVQL